MIERRGVYVAAGEDETSFNKVLPCRIKIWDAEVKGGSPGYPACFLWPEERTYTVSPRRKGRDDVIAYPNEALPSKIRPSLQDVDYACEQNKCVVYSVLEFIDLRQLTHLEIETHLTRMMRVNRREMSPVAARARIKLPLWKIYAWYSWCYIVQELLVLHSSKTNAWSGAEHEDNTKDANCVKTCNVRARKCAKRRRISYTQLATPPGTLGGC